MGVVGPPAATRPHSGRHGPGASDSRGGRHGSRHRSRRSHARWPQGQPVVALESTLICHGLPRPRNLELARAVEAAVLAERRRAGHDRPDRRADPGRPGRADARATGAQPTMSSSARRATWHWCWRAGRSVQPRSPAPSVSRPRPASGSWRRVASAACIAAGEQSLDVSADLHELGRSGVAVVCSGAKIILDLPRTLEVLETPGGAGGRLSLRYLPRLLRPRQRPAGAPPRRDRHELAALVRAQARSAGRPEWSSPTRHPRIWRCRRRSWKRGSPTALADARARGVAGKEETPFLLAALARLSEGRTVTLNEALVLDNARLAARRRHGVLLKRAAWTDFP